jgi:DNA processing protein
VINQKINIIEKKDFPKQLVKISNCPEKLFYFGEWSDELFIKTLAIVGSRKMTRYGKEIIEKFMPEIVAQKTTVISGFMYGVDCEAHQQCLNLGGKTVAILGGGPEWIWRNGDKKMYSEIIESGGLIISEYEPNFMPTLWSFPQRNRIVAGLSTLGVLVVEAGIKSGSLITAKLALKQKKRLMAIPGQITSKISEGTNWLIKSGAAKLVSGVGDIFENAIRSPIQVELFKDYSDLSETEKKIISLLENEEMTIDDLCRKIHLSVAELSTTLSMMIIRDLVTEENGKLYLS